MKHQTFHKSPIAPRLNNMRDKFRDNVSFRAKHFSRSMKISMDITHLTSKVQIRLGRKKERRIKNEPASSQRADPNSFFMTQKAGPATERATQISHMDRLGWLDPHNIGLLVLKG